MARPSEITSAQMLARSRDPFVTHQVDTRTIERVWALGEALVVQGGRHRSRNQQPGPVLTCLGPSHELVPLMHHVAAAVDQRPGRVTMEQAARAEAPADWRYAHVRTWDWLWTDRPPDDRPPTEAARVHDADQINAVLDAANPDSFARPGAPGVEVWYGARDDAGLVGVGALETMADGTGHLRGVSVLPRARGTGVGRVVSHALTLHALADGSGVVTLGVYSDNEPALAIYRRLGFDTAHRFYSGAVVRPGS